MEWTQYAMIIRCANGLGPAPLGPGTTLWHIRGPAALSPQAGFVLPRARLPSPSWRTDHRMNPPMTNDTGNWNQGDLEDLFFWLQRVFQKYAENPACQECLRLAGEGLAQIRAGLDAAGRDDIVQLCEEMQRAVADLEAERVEWSPDGSELLVRAALQMSGPLGLTAAEPGRLARVLLPLVNELRALRGAGRLMTPAIVLAAESPAPAEAASWIRALRDARRQFQHGLLDLLHGRDIRVAAARLGDATAKVATALPEGHGSQLFRAAARLATALAGTGVVPSARVKQLLGRVDRQLGDGVQAAERMLSGGRDPRQGAFAGDAELLRRLAEALDGLETPPAPEDPTRGRDLLETAVPGAGAREAPTGAGAALEGRAQDLSAVLEDWHGVSEDPAGLARIEACFRGLGADARARGTPRIEDFAAIMERFIATRGGVGATDVEVAQVIEDAVNVFPGLLAELRTAGAAETPVADIVLRAEAILQAGTPEDAAEEEDGDGELVGEDEASLARMRSKGGADMARLASAFAALENGARASVGGGPEGGDDSGSAAAVMDMRARAGEISVWHRRIVAALTEAAGEVQMLERVISRLRSVLAAESLDGLVERAEDGAAPAGIPGMQQVLDELEQLRLTLGTAIGNASAALLQQHRSAQALEDRLAIDPAAEASGDT